MFGWSTSADISTCKSICKYVFCMPIFSIHPSIHQSIHLSNPIYLSNPIQSNLSICISIQSNPIYLYIIYLCVCVSGHISPWFFYAKNSPRSKWRPRRPPPAHASTSPAEATRLTVATLRSPFGIDENLMVPGQPNGFWCWFMMMIYDLCILVGGWFFATPLKKDGVSEFVSWDDILFPTERKKMFQTTNQLWSFAMVYNPKITWTRTGLALLLFKPPDVIVMGKSSTYCWWIF